MIEAPAQPAQGLDPVHRRPARSVAEIEKEIAELSGLSRSDLVARWRRAFGSDPPRGISMRLMAGAVGYALQAKRYGGLKAVLRRRLEAASEPGASGIPAKQAASRRVGPGTRLVREWYGTTHVVDAVEGGFLWNGERHASLSAIARAITGARWSGPRFFGLDGEGAS